MNHLTTHKLYSLHMYHPIQKRPKQHICEKSPENPIEPDGPSGSEVLVPARACLDGQEDWEKNGVQDEESKPVEASQSQYPSCSSRDGSHWCAAVIYQCMVVSHCSLVKHISCQSFHREAGWLADEFIGWWCYQWLIDGVIFSSTTKFRQSSPLHLWRESKYWGQIGSNKLI